MSQAVQEFYVDSLSVRAFRNQADLAEAAAQAAADALGAAIRDHGAARAIFASANSQIQFLGALARHRVDWPRVTCFHMDEYLGLGPEHPASFRRFLGERIEEGLHPAAFHYLAGEVDQPLAECARYEALLTEHPIDLCCLGVGENGHLAFNDPPVADFKDRWTVKLVKLDEACRRQQVGEGHFPSLEAVPQFAYTLTIPALCAARRMVCVVPERRKAAAVRAMLRGPISPACPASWLRTQSQATLFLDAESASLL